MLLTATVQVAATADDPMNVALTALELLRAQVLADERSSLKFSVVARDNSRFMTYLKSIAAAQPGAHQNLLRGCCEVILTDTATFADAVSFIAGLLADWPDVLTTASLSIYAEGIRWRAAPESSVGSLRLIDRKELTRGTPEQRSSLVAELTCRGASLEDAAFLASLKATSEETGLAFRLGQLMSSHDPQGGRPAGPAACGRGRFPRGAHPHRRRHSPPRSRLARIPRFDDLPRGHRIPI